MPIDYTRRFRPESAEWEQSRAINDILDELSTHNSTYASLNPAGTGIVFNAYRRRTAYGLTPVASESAWYDGSRSNGTDVWRCTRKRHLVFVDSWGVRFVYANCYNRDALPVDNITVRAGAEVGSTIVPVFFGGKRDVTIEPGGFAISDPIALDIPAGASLYSRTLVTVASVGMKWPAQGTGFGSSGQANTVAAWGEGSETGAGTSTDKTTSGTFTATDTLATYVPVSVLGMGSSPLPFIGIDGDSIASGLGDTSAPVAAGRGFIRRALGGSIPHVSIAASGQFITDSTAYRDQLVLGCTDIICETLTNDIVGGATAAACYTALIARWRKHARRGARAWQTTITPKSASTDSWATTGNQTTDASNTVRTAVNDWIRDGAPTDASLNPVAVGTSTTGTLRAGATGHPLAGYFETADTVETARNSGIWKVGYVFTGDSAGLHPTSTGAAAMSAAIDVTRFTRAL